MGSVIDSSTPGRTHYKRLLENEHLGQWDLQKDDGSYLRATVVIERVTGYLPPRRRMKDGKPERHNKLLISFAGKRKRWIAGPVSQQAIAALYGSFIQDWIGKKITLYFDPSVTMGRKKVGGIRVANVPPSEEPTADPLDREVDADLRALQNEAFGRENEQDDAQPR